MKTATVTEFRTRAKELLKEVEDDQDILILSRPKSKDGFVVLTMKHYESLEETAHLLSTAANASRLMEGIAQDKAGMIGKAFKLQDLVPEEIGVTEVASRQVRSAARIIAGAKKRHGQPKRK